jgi:hypothetical protein
LQVRAFVWAPPATQLPSLLQTKARVYVPFNAL